MEKRRDPWIQLHIADYRHIRAYCKARKLRSAASIIDVLLAYRSLWRGPGTNERDLRLTREDCRELGLDKSTLARGTQHLVLMGYLDVVRLGRTKNGFRCSIYGLPDATIQGSPVHRDLRPTVSSIATASTTDGERSHLSPMTVSSIATERPLTVSSIAGERSHLPPPLVPPERSGGGTSCISDLSHPRSGCRDPEGEKNRNAPLHSADAPSRSAEKKVEEIEMDWSDWNELGSVTTPNSDSDSLTIPTLAKGSIVSSHTVVERLTKKMQSLQEDHTPQTSSDPTPIVSHSVQVTPVSPRSPGGPRIEDFTLEDFFGDFPVYRGVSTIEESTFRNKEVLMKMYNSKVQKYATGAIKKDRSAPPLSRCSLRFQEYYRAHKSEYKEVARGT